MSTLNFKSFLNNNFININRIFKPLILLFRIFGLASIQRKRQLFFLSFLFFLSSISEVISIASIYSLLSFLSNPESLNDYKLIKNTFDFLNIYNQSLILISITIFFTLITLISSFLRISNIFLIGRLSASIGNDLSTDAFANSIYQPYSLHANRNSSDLISTLTIEIQSTVNALRIGLQLISAFILFVFIITGLFIANAKIAFLSLITFGLVYLFVSYKTNRQLSIKSKIITDSNKGLVKEIQEAFGGIKEIILGSNQHFYLKRVNKMDKRKRFSEADIEFISSSPYYFLEAIAFIFFAFLALFFSLRTLNPQALFTTIGTLAIALQKLLRSMQQIYQGITVLKGRQKSLEIVLNAFAIPIEKDLRNIGVKELPLVDKINLNGVFFKFEGKSRPVLRNINLELKFGETVGFIGPTGSGKSTLLNIIMGLLNPTKGQITIGENDINKIPFAYKRFWYSSISHVPQDIFLSDSSIAENIAFGRDPLNISMERLIKAAKTAQIYDFIKSLPSGFDTYVGEGGIKLSGGQKQRIVIARAVYKKSKILVLDEATSALDNSTEEEVMKLIENLNKNMTVFIIAHRLTTLSKCDKIVEIKNGEIISIRDSV